MQNSSSKFRILLFQSSKFQLYSIQSIIYYPLNCTVNLYKTTLFYCLINIQFFFLIYEFQEK